MSERAIVDINTLRRNLASPRTGQTPAEYAQAWHAEELERGAKLPERLILFLAGCLVGLAVLGALSVF